MSRLTIVGYDDPDRADEVRLKLRKLQREYVVDLKDAVVAVQDQQGKVKLHQSVDFSADGTLSFSFLGSLTGLILQNAAAGAGSGALTDVGIDARFMKELAGTLRPGSSVLVVLTGRLTPHRDKLLEVLKGTGGKILQTTLSHEDQGALQVALSAAREGSSSVVVRGPGARLAAMKWTIQQDAIALDGLHKIHGAHAELLLDKLHRMGPQKRTPRVHSVEPIWQRTGQDPR